MRENQMKHMLMVGREGWYCWFILRVPLFPLHVVVCDGDKHALLILQMKGRPRSFIYVVHNGCNYKES